MPSSIPSITPAVQQIEAAINYFSNDTRVQPSYFIYETSEDALRETVDRVCKLELEVEKLKQQLGGNIKL